MTAFSERLKESRERRGLSVAELATLSGVPAPTLYRLESGGSPPSYDNLVKVAKALKTSSDTLLGLPHRAANVDGAALAESSKRRSGGRR